MFFGLFRRKENTGTEVTLRQENSTVWVDAPKTLHCRVKMYDLAGNKVLDFSVNTNTGIGIKYLPASLYEVRVVTGDGFRLKKQIAVGIGQ